MALCSKEQHKQVDSPPMSSPINSSQITTMDKTFDDLQDDMKSYSYLTTANGKIVLNPGVKKNIKCFMAWCKDEIRMGRKPSLIAAFPLGNITTNRYMTHKKFVDNSYVNSKSAIPKTSSMDVKWIEWKLTFENYLRTLPGRNDVPIKYVIRSNKAPNAMPQLDMMDEYINMTPLEGEAYVQDNIQVMTLLANFLVNNYEAEAEVQALNKPNDGRATFVRLMEHYEGVMALSPLTSQVRNKPSQLSTIGEKPPHNTWVKFEQHFRSSYCTR